jgi:hypothetical protein
MFACQSTLRTMLRFDQQQPLSAAQQALLAEAWGSFSARAKGFLGQQGSRFTVDKDEIDAIISAEPRRSTRPRCAHAA